MNSHKTEELVRKCFCPKHLEDCIFQAVCSDCFMRKESSRIARAARRFVRMEQAEKIKKHNEFMKKFYRNRAKLHNENIVKLPKHFGEI